MEIKLDGNYLVVGKDLFEILKYLGKRPYEEVAQYMARLSQAEEQKKSAVKAVNEGNGT